MSLIKKIKTKKDLVSCEEAINRMIHYLKMIKNDLTCERNPEDCSIMSLGIRLDNFNEVNKVFQDYVAEILPS